MSFIMIIISFKAFLIPIHIRKLLKPEGQCNIRSVLVDIRSQFQCIGILVKFYICTSVLLLHHPSAHFNAHILLQNINSNCYCNYTNTCEQSVQ